MSTPVLESKNLTMRFGGLVAVDNFSFQIGSHELVGVIGPNGAGKTTVFNMITGIYSPSEGQILLDGKNITEKRPAAINQEGVARTFQNIRLFKDLSVLDNIRVAQHYRSKQGLMSSILRTPSFHREEEHNREEAIKLLKIFDLEKDLEALAKNLPYGKQRRLEMARALATGPKVLLLDEPAAGMNPRETVELTELIKWVRDKFKVAILLIEHDMKLVMEVCERIYVLDYGVLIAQGTPKEIQKNPKVIEAYLGAPEEGA